VVWAKRQKLRHRIHPKPPGHFSGAIPTFEPLRLLQGVGINGVLMQLTGCPIQPAPCATHSIRPQKAFIRYCRFRFSDFQVSPRLDGFTCSARSTPVWVIHVKAVIGIAPDFRAFFGIFFLYILNSRQTSISRSQIRCDAIASGSPTPLGENRGRLVWLCPLGSEVAAMLMHEKRVAQDEGCDCSHLEISPIKA